MAIFNSLTSRLGSVPVSSSFNSSSDLFRQPLSVITRRTPATFPHLPRSFLPRSLFTIQHLVFTAGILGPPPDNPTIEKLGDNFRGSNQTNFLRSFTVPLPTSSPATAFFFLPPAQPRRFLTYLQLFPFLPPTVTNRHHRQQRRLQQPQLILSSPDRQIFTQLPAISRKSASARNHGSLDPREERGAPQRPRQDHVDFCHSETAGLDRRLHEAGWIPGDHLGGYQVCSHFFIVSVFMCRFWT